ncbi:MAG: oligosaccharide flippase family protein [Solobacterium sp.]|jgi:O-antigen/teichoic acid export membrane protein|nr:oligosaccharide flippase family protein [Solobacterium sp.]MCH4223169.1 oligosaccharide flippase family protein [Solobacterium sp.]
MAQKSLKKNLSWTTAGMVLYNFAIWVLSALTLRMLGATMSGYYAVAMSIGNTMYAIALWGMRSFIVSDQKHEFSYGEYCGARLIGISIGALGLVAVLLFTHYDSTQVLILILYSAFKFAEALTELMDCFMQEQKQMDINAKSMILRSVLYIALFYAALKVTGSLAIGLAVILVLALLVFVFFNLRVVKERVSIKGVIFNQGTWKIVKECFPIMMFESLAAAVVAIPRLRYETIGSLDALGIYTSIYTMVIFLQLVINVLIYTFAPYMAEAYQNHDHKSFMKQVVILFAGAAGLGLLAEVLVYFLGEPVIGLLYGADVGPYYTYLYVGILSGVTMVWTMVFSQLFTILRHTYDQLICSAVSTIACYLLSNLLVTAADCNSISVTLIWTNIIFICTAVIILIIRRKQKAAD